MNENAIRRKLLYGYYLERAKDDNVKAKIRLREETLLRWIRNFELSLVKLKELSSWKLGKRKSYKSNSMIF